MARKRGVCGTGLCPLLTSELDASLGLPRSHCHPSEERGQLLPAKVILILMPGDCSPPHPRKQWRQEVAGSRVL